MPWPLMQRRKHSCGCFQQQLDYRCGIINSDPELHMMLLAHSHATDYCQYTCLHDNQYCTLAFTSNSTSTALDNLSSSSLINVSKSFSGQNLNLIRLLLTMWHFSA